MDNITPGAVATIGPAVVGLPSQLDIALRRAAEDCSISPDSPVARFSSAF